MAHKALELLARAKLAVQNGENEFLEPELSPTPFPVSITADEAIEAGWNHYNTGYHKFAPADRREVVASTYEVLNFRDGAFDPRKRRIICPELYFDITIEEDWASYDYELPNGEVLHGQLSLKGTVDLILEGNGGPGTLEYVDYKTGQRKDWGTGRIKEYDDLYEDFQLRLYHYALCNRFPDVSDILMTIFYTKDGGPFSLPYERDELGETISRIREWFTGVKNAAVPERKIGFPCTTFCDHGKTEWSSAKYLDPSIEPAGAGKSVCNHMYEEVVILGVDRVMAKYAKLDKLTAYGSGGGVQDRVEPATPSKTG